MFFLMRCPFEPNQEAQNIPMQLSVGLEQDLKGTNLKHSYLPAWLNSKNLGV